MEGTADVERKPAAGTAWITGAGRGIGRAVALALAKEGWVVAASARTAAELDSLVAEAAAAGGRVVAFPLDVTSAAGAEAVVAAVEAGLGPLDLAILNAGTHEPTRATEFDLGRAARVVEVNLLGTMNCLAPVMARFVARKAGHVVVVGSVAGYCGLPSAAAYAASKAGLIAMCESLMPELEQAGVRLQLVSPGFVDTPLARRNDFPMPFLVPADAAAKAIVAGLRSRRFEIAFPWRMAVLMRLLRRLPYPLFFAVTRRLVRRPAVTASR